MELFCAFLAVALDETYYYCLSTLFDVVAMVTNDGGRYNSFMKADGS